MRDALALAALWWLMTRDVDRPIAPPRRRVVSNVSLEDRNAVIQAVGQHGWPVREVDRTIGVESGWRTDAVNPNTGAVGLLQFMPRTLRGLGWQGSAADFAALDARAQLPFVERYYAQLRWSRPGDTYLAAAYPRALGAPDGHVVGPVASPIWRQNPLWRSGADGPVTAGSIRRVLLDRMG